MSNIDDNIVMLLEWYTENQDPIPMQLHSSKVFASDGRPDWTASFKEYLFWSPEAVEYKYDTVPCHHENQSDPGKCEICGVRGPDGGVLTSSGKYRKATARYKHPMRRAMAKLAQSERGLLFAEILLVCSQQGAEVGIRAIRNELKVPTDKAKELLLLALLRVCRYYKSEPQYSPKGLAQNGKRMHTYPRPKRLGTPDRS